MVKHLVETQDVRENVFRPALSGSSPSEILSGLNCLVFNSSPRLFYMNEPETIRAEKRRELFKQIRKNLPSNVYIVFATSDQKVSKEITDTFESDIEKIDFWPPFENQLPAWIQKEASDLGVKIAADAVNLILSRLGADLALLHGELAKLALSSPPGGVISASLVKSNVAFFKHESVFDLLDSIAARNLKEALKISDLLIQRGEAPIKLWAMIVKTIREFRLLHDFAQDRPDLGLPVLSSLRDLAKLHGKSDFKSNQEKKRLQTLIAGQIKEWPAVIREMTGIDKSFQIKTLSMATRYKPVELSRCWERMISIEAKLKLSPPNPALIIQEFLTSFLPPENQSGYQ